MRLKKLISTLLGMLALAGLVGIIYSLPPVQQRLGWRLDFALAYARGVVNPVGKMPTALPQPRVVTFSRPTATPNNPPAAPAQAESQTSPTPLPPTPTASPIPAAVSLPAPRWEKQDANNCGPATLALYLRYYSWEGDQYTISELVKPQRDDRNVNVDELLFYTRTRAGWLNSLFRVDGDIELLKQLLAAGIPVMIEETFVFDEEYWPNDDNWAAHYNLLTAYDDATQTFTTQDTFIGADRRVSYARLDEDWRSFNRVYLLVYPPNLEETVKQILGEDWDEAVNRQNALETAQAETEQRPEDAFAWFNLGANLVYFERYDEAAAAFDQARAIGLPQRMLRYQFSPFFAYFYTRRMEDLAAISDYALQITKNSEEALLWRGWGLFRQGDSVAALESFQQALAENPNYQDARYAIDFVKANP
jgi:hypothetical protein